MGRGVTDHPPPGGSGTGARAKRNPVEQRGGGAVDAWVRHKTNGHDGNVIPKVRGKGREWQRSSMQNYIFCTCWKLTSFRRRPLVWASTCQNTSASPKRLRKNPWPAFLIQNGRRAERSSRQ